MKRVFIIHGWEGSPEGNWFPWLKAQLANNGFQPFVLKMPNPDFPQQTEWTEYLREQVGKVDTETFFVGHSLGVIAILRFLESLSVDSEIGGAVFVAGFAEKIQFHELDSFFEKTVEFEKIKKLGGKFIVIHADNDPLVPFELGKKLSDSLNAGFVVFNGGGHLNADEGFVELPIVFEKIREISK